MLVWVPTTQVQICFLPFIFTAHCHKCHFLCLRFQKELYLRCLLTVNRTTEISEVCVHEWGVRTELICIILAWKQNHLLNIHSPLVLSCYYFSLGDFNFSSGFGLVSLIDKKELVICRGLKNTWYCTKWAAKEWIACRTITPFPALPTLFLEWYNSLPNFIVITSLIWFYVVFHAGFWKGCSILDFSWR